MSIIGYSERGIVNSLIYNIGENKKLLKEFIELIYLPTQIEIGNPTDYEILIEQSFSRFGSSDLIIIIHYENPKDKKVLFLEAKVKTFSGNWKLSKQYDKYGKSFKKNNGYSSNLFFQLNLKRLMIDNFKDIKAGVKDELKDLRKIGDNKIVSKAADKIEGFKKAYYIGIIPTSDYDISSFIDDNKQQNSNPNRFVSWESIHSFCKENNLVKVLDIFKYNEGQIYKVT